MSRLTAVVYELRKQKQEKQSELNRLDEAIATISRLTARQVSGGVRGKRILSAAARLRIAAAQKKRWAQWKVAQRKKAA
jgi:hypothetical protein